MGAPAIRDRARELRKTPTEAERLLWKYLRRRQLNGHRFRRQHPIGPYVVDFYSFEQHVAVELDGGQHNQRTDYDAERTVFLESKGVRVLRFWNNEVLGDIGTVQHVIADALGSD